MTKSPTTLESGSHPKGCNKIFPAHNQPKTLNNSISPATRINSLPCPSLHSCRDTHVAIHLDSIGVKVLWTSDLPPFQISRLHRVITKVAKRGTHSPIRAQRAVSEPQERLSLPSYRRYRHNGDTTIRSVASVITYAAYHRTFLLRTS